MAFTGILDDLSGYLAAAGIGLTVGTNLFGGVLPNAPDAATALLEYSSEAPLESMGNKAVPAIEQPNLQVMVRDPDYAAGELMAHNVWTKLRVIANQSINTQFYVAVLSKQSPFHVHSDNSRRHFFACNYTVLRSL